MKEREKLDEAGQQMMTNLESVPLLYSLAGKKTGTGLTLFIKRDLGTSLTTTTSTTTTTTTT